MDVLSLIRQEFELDSDIIYLNHAAVAPWPLRTASAVRQFADENLHRGAAGYLDWMAKEALLHKQFAELINAPATDDIALLKNTSEALSVVAYGLSWQDGDNIVISNEEFPSNRIVWHSLKQYGVEVREVDLSSAESPEQALLSACDDRTRLLSISAVQYASGIRMQLEVLGRACRQQGILFCVDAIQAIGALTFDVQQINADFVMADTHKWMLGPEAVALFYCRAECRDSLKLHQFGWHMLKDPTNYTSNDWQFSSGARRFECGSPNMLGIHAASASLSLLHEIGMPEVESMVLDNSRFLIEQLKQLPSVNIISNPEPQRLSGIVTFRREGIESKALYESLMKSSVICAARGGGVRFSPHFYTDREKLHQALEIMQQID